LSSHRSHSPPEGLPKLFTEESSSHFSSSLVPKSTAFSFLEEMPPPPPVHFAIRSFRASGFFCASLSPLPPLALDFSPVYGFVTKLPLSSFAAYRVRSALRSLCLLHSSSSTSQVLRSPLVAGKPFFFPPPLLIFLMLLTPLSCPPPVLALSPPKHPGWRPSPSENRAPHILFTLRLLMQRFFPENYPLRRG